MIPSNLPGPVKRTLDVQPEQDVKRTRSPAVVNPASNKPLYVRVFEIAAPIIVRLEKNQLVFPGAFKTLGQALLNPTFSDSDYQIFCQKILNAIIPYKAPTSCPLEMLPDVVEKAINEKIDDVVQLINSLDVGSVCAFPTKATTRITPRFPIQPKILFHGSEKVPLTKVLSTILPFFFENTYVASQKTFIDAFAHFLKRALANPVFLEAYLDDSKTLGSLIQQWESLTSFRVCQPGDLASSFELYFVGKLCSDQWRKLDDESLTQLITRLEVVALTFPRSGQEAPQDAISRDNLDFLRQGKKNTTLSIPFRVQCVGLLNWINPAVTGVFSLKYLNGTSRPLTSAEFSALTQCRYFEQLFDSPMKESSENSVLIGRDRTEGDERPVGDFDQFIPTPEQMERFIAFMMGQQSVSINYYQWVNLLQFADYFALKDYTRLFQLLTPKLLNSYDNLADCITTITKAVAAGEPILKKLWKEHRDDLISRLLDKTKDLEEFRYVLSILIEYDAHPDYQEPWMKIGHLKLKIVSKEILDEAKKLRELRSLTIITTNLGNLVLSSRFPALQCLEIRGCDYYHDTKHLKLQTLIKPIRFIENWRLGLECYPNLKDLFFTCEDKSQMSGSLYCKLSYPFYSFKPNPTFLVT